MCGVVWTYFDIHVNLTLLLNCLKKLTLEWMFSRRRKMTVGEGLQCFCFGWRHKWSGESWEGLIWTESSAAAQQFDLVQSVKHFEAVVSLAELLLAVWVVWFDLAARLAVILQEKETRGDSPVSPKTHHLLHFVDFVSCDIRQNCPQPLRTAF